MSKLESVRALVFVGGLCVLAALLAPSVWAESSDHDRAAPKPKDNFMSLYRAYKSPPKQIRPKRVVRKNTRSSGNNRKDIAAARLRLDELKFVLGIGAAPVAYGDDSWWRPTDKAAIISFRDCVAGKVRSAGLPASSSDYRRFVRTLLEPACQEQRDFLAASLRANRSGEEYMQVSERLIQEVFVPAVHMAADVSSAALTAQPLDRAASIEQPIKERSRKFEDRIPSAPDDDPVVFESATGTAAPTTQPEPGPAPAAQGGGLTLDDTKDRMFACFNNTADYLAVNTRAVPADIAVSVMDSCARQAAQFFIRLNEVTPVSAYDHAKRMESAISQVYRPAIAQRVQHTRMTAVEPVADLPANSAGQTPAEN